MILENLDNETPVNEKDGRIPEVQEWYVKEGERKWGLSEGRCSFLGAANEDGVAGTEMAGVFSPPRRSPDACEQTGKCRIRKNSYA